LTFSKPHGLLLCGGRSRRMGEDKWQLKIKGQSYWQHGYQQLKKLSDQVFISSQEVLPLEGLQDQDFILDLHAGEGPLGAFLSFAQQHPDRDLISLPVDMPLLSSEDLKLLLDSGSSYLVSENERAPLAAYLECRHFAYLIKRFDEGLRSVTRFWEEIDHQKCHLPHDHVLKNVNSPEDLVNIEKNQL
jgi:molybdopterin-guanine dinucleotide biosynthesis protein A